jgi:hypothetical protein
MRFQELPVDSYFFLPSHGHILFRKKSLATAQTRGIGILFPEPDASVVPLTFVFNEVLPGRPEATALCIGDYEVPIQPQTPALAAKRIIDESLTGA